LGDGQVEWFGQGVHVFAERQRVNRGLGGVGVGRAAGAYQVRVRHIASLGRHFWSIREWISAGKRRNGVNIVVYAIGSLDDRDKCFKAGSSGIKDCEQMMLGHRSYTGKWKGIVQWLMQVVIYTMSRVDSLDLGRNR
jgi:hypothetical protein